MNGQTDKRRLRPMDLALFLLSCAIGVLAFWQSHQRWLDPIIDVGRDLYIPEQLVEGRKLYRDFTYNYPPLTPYLLAVVTSIAGSSLRVYLVSGAVVALLTGGALYWISTITANRVAAVLASTLFFALNFTSGVGTNYLFPYSYASVFGVMFLLVHLGATLHYRFARPTTWLLVVALCAGLAASWSRIEVAAIVFALVIIATAVYRFPLWYLVSFVISLIASGGIVHLCFTDQSTSPWRHMFSPPLLFGQRARAFYSLVSGAADWKERLPEMLFGAVLIASIVALLSLLERRVVLGRLRWSWRLAAFALAFMVFLFARVDIFFRGWTLLQILLIPLAVRMRDRSPLLLLLVVSALASSRIYLNLMPSGYGFVFIVPVYPLILYVLFELLPQRRIYSPTAALFWVPMILAVAASGLRAQWKLYARGVHSIVTKQGTFYDLSKDRAAVLNGFLGYMERRGHAAGMVVLPEGLTLNYFVGIRNPLRYYLFTPVETADPSIERNVVAELSREQPELVVEITRPMDEYRSAGFGVDYNRGLRRQIDRDYVVERAWRRREFSLILRRRANLRPSIRE